MDFSIVKALHIIFMVSWFAALFYMPRLLIYFVEANSKAAESKEILQDQFRIMQKRLWFIIGWPAMVLTLVFGIWMLVLRPVYLEFPWMHVKLSMVLILTIYHLATHNIYLKVRNNQSKMSSTKLRLWNEIATILLFAIVFVVVMKDSLSWIWAIVSLVLLAIVLMLATKWYKKKRESKQSI